MGQLRVGRAAAGRRLRTLADAHRDQRCILATHRLRPRDPDGCGAAHPALHRLAFPITRNGRTFYYGRPDVADAARKLLEAVPNYAKPGDKLFVGTTDLRKTPYSDAYLYYLLPEYPPGTYYIEMDPGVANAKGSRLASDLRHSQIAILSGVWNNWSEPNDSLKFGSDAANKVLARDFCQKRTFGVRPDDPKRTPLYELWVKCDKPQ